MSSQFFRLPSKNSNSFLVPDCRDAPIRSVIDFRFLISLVVFSIWLVVRAEPFFPSADIKSRLFLPPFSNVSCDFSRALNHCFGATFAPKWYYQKTTNLNWTLSIFVGIE